MLIGIPSILGPEMLATLRAMGHGAVELSVLGERGYERCHSPPYVRVLESHQTGVRGPRRQRRRYARLLEQHVSPVEQ